MGVKRLKIKDELHYRSGRTMHHCSDCNHFVAGEQPIPGKRQAWRGPVRQGWAGCGAAMQAR